MNFYGFKVAQHTYGFTVNTNRFSILLVRIDSIICCKPVAVDCDLQK